MRTRFESAHTPDGACARLLDTWLYGSHSPDVLVRRRRMAIGRKSTVAAVLVAVLALARPTDPAQDRAAADVLIIGAGIAGLTAAIEASSAGASVLIVEMSTVGGGHAILSNGAVSIVGTPLQDSRKIADSPDLAERDFLARGEDNERQWVAAYVRDSREWIYDWLTELGVSFENLVRPAGNTVPRLHMTKGKGLGLVEPIYRAALSRANIRFLWATAAEELIVRKGRVTGTRVRDLRHGKGRDLDARHVIVATGGFQSNLQRVTENWPSDLPKPTRILAGAAHTATGSGHELAGRVNGRISRLDHQWNYVLGFPDPRDPSRTRGLAAFNINAIWVNAAGQRFTPEFGDEKLGLRALLNQPGGTYWSVFDEEGEGGFSVTLAGWENRDEIRHLVYDTPGVVVMAESIEKLASAIRVPAANLTATISRYNQLAVEGIDRDFRAFTEKTFPKPKPIDTAPFYAAQFFPITRKSMGGIAVDLECRVLDTSGKPIPGLYAVGEVTGFAGINGKAALEGTFLGPAVYMGRIAGRAVAREVGSRSTQTVRRPARNATTREFDDAECVKCHDVRKDVTLQRPGYWHFEQSHTKVLARAYSCSSCHGDLLPYRAADHRLDRSRVVTYCRACHGVQPRDGPPARP
jgi:uncharacterized protein